MSTKLYVIEGQRVITKLDSYRSSIQIPSFLLHENIQGIRNAEHAKDIALKILSEGLSYFTGLHVEYHLVVGIIELP